MSNGENSALAPVNTNASVGKGKGKGTANTKADEMANLLVKLTAALAANTAAVTTGFDATVSAIASNTSAITAGFAANTIAVTSIAQGIDTLNVSTVALGTFQERLARTLEAMGANAARRVMVEDQFTYEGIPIMLVVEFLTIARDNAFIQFSVGTSCSIKKELAAAFCFFLSKRLPSQEPTVTVAGNILVQHLSRVRETAGTCLENIDDNHPIRAFHPRSGHSRNVLKCWKVSDITPAQAFNDAAPAYQAN
ncbi:hypothetical protein HDU88_008722 [Geranomyces variabilis]|nr:hypothetical protein HDU88_008722 [Geranomyces variabilis]